MKSNLIYNFDRQRTFRAGYIARNSRSSREYKEHDEKSISQEDSLLAKSKWDKNYSIFPLWVGNQTYESTYFLAYNCHVTNLGIDSGFNHEL